MKYWLKHFLTSPTALSFCLDLLNSWRQTTIYELYKTIGNILNHPYIAKFIKGWFKHSNYHGRCPRFRRKRKPSAHKLSISCRLWWMKIRVQEVSDLSAHRTTLPRISPIPSSPVPAERNFMLEYPPDTPYIIQIEYVTLEICLICCKISSGWLLVRLTVKDKHSRCPKWAEYCVIGSVYVGFSVPPPNGNSLGTRTFSSADCMLNHHVD